MGKQQGNEQVCGPWPALVQGEKSALGRIPKPRHHNAKDALGPLFSSCCWSGRPVAFSVTNAARVRPAPGKQQGRLLSGSEQPSGQLDFCDVRGTPAVDASVVSVCN